MKRPLFRQLRSPLLFLGLALLATTLLFCGPPTTPLEGVPADLDAQLASSLFRVGFGSCNKQDADQSYWSTISSKGPKLWIWGGDIIYADTRDMNELQQDYQKLKSAPAYKSFAEKVPIIGIWDDHDYGENDAGKEYPKKVESQQHFLDFMGEPQDSPRRKQQGVYTAYEYPVGQRKLKVILLDTRYDREQAGGTLLSEAQWTWLEQTLKDSKADLHFLVSSSQVLREDTDKDTWVQYPKSRDRLFGLLKTYKTPGVVLLTGDIHVGEISKSEKTGLTYPVYEFTSSGLTHTRDFFYLNNAFRKYLVRGTNFGMIDLTERDQKLFIHLQLFDIKGELRAYQQIALDTLQPTP
ncbi:MAG: alkaline phosphatase family protein [Myxococcales bacterium]|nr:alkaline phosphatase family protein [Myxococcales bacterium]